MDHGISAFANRDDHALARAAVNGNTHSLASLFERYRPALYATAVSLLGYSGDAEDAVHDTFLVAVTRLAQLRDPAAFGGWLFAILKNQCLMEKRRQRRRPQIGGEAAERHFRELPGDDSIETEIENRELRDWVWAALDRLPEPQRITVILRYFGSFESYEDIAAILGVPVGTVRSRLSDAKLRLSELLLAPLAGTNDRHHVMQAERQELYADAFAGLYRGGRDKFLSRFDDDLHLLWSTGTQSHGRSHFDAEIDTDLRTGVRIASRRIMASGDLTVIEGDFLNPPETPGLCPPGCVLVFKEGARQVQRVHIHLAARPVLPLD